MGNIGILDAGIVALLGYAVVFFGLILLMIVVSILGKAFSAKDAKAAKAAPAEAAPAAPAAPEEVFSSGSLKLKNCDEKTAAMIMAIVADDSGIPLEELVFKSIKLVEKD